MLVSRAAAMGFLALSVIAAPGLAADEGAGPGVEAAVVTWSGPDAVDYTVRTTGDVVAAVVVLVDADGRDIGHDLFVRPEGHTLRGRLVVPDGARAVGAAVTVVDGSHGSASTAVPLPDGQARAAEQTRTPERDVPGAAGLAGVLVGGVAAALRDRRR